jgi:hypothetical protein
LAGKGRTGTIIACVLVAKGYSATDALSIFAMSRGQAVSQPSQVALLICFCNLFVFCNFVFAQIRYVGYFEKLLLSDDRRAPAPVMHLRRIQVF